MEKMLQTMIDNMPEKTGKSLAEWKHILASKNFQKHSEGVGFLKKEHGVTHGFANTIVTLSKNEDHSSEDLVTGQYKGKETLIPIYNTIVDYVNKLGSDVEIAPKKTSVSLRRKKQFALIKPATKSRIDLGLKFSEKPLTERLQDSGPFGTMCTHRVQLSDLGDVDNELKFWLKEAYEQAG